MKSFEKLPAASKKKQNKTRLAVSRRFLEIGVPVVSDVRSFIRR